MEDEFQDGRSWADRSVIREKREQEWIWVAGTIAFSLQTRRCWWKRHLIVVQFHAVDENTNCLSLTVNHLPLPYHLPFLSFPSPGNPLYTDLIQHQDSIAKMLD